MNKCMQKLKPYHEKNSSIFNQVSSKAFVHNPLRSMNASIDKFLSAYRRKKGENKLTQEQQGRHQVE
jgi:hypothetical protein